MTAELYVICSSVLALVAVGVACARTDEHLLMPTCIIVVCAAFMWPATLLIGLGYVAARRFS